MDTPFPRPARALLPAVALLWTGACAPQAEAEAPAQVAASEQAPKSESPPVSAKNLVLISVDTLRQDRLGAYGYGRDTSPRIDRLAAEGAVFEDATAESSWTLPSHATMLTGLHPLRHGVIERDHKVGPEQVLLSELLARNGFATLAFTGAGFLSGKRGFDQGFDSFEGFLGTRGGRKFGLGRGVHRALARIDELEDRRFFLFLHTFATHCPFTPPDPFAGTFTSPDASPAELQGKCARDFEEAGLDAAQVRYVSDHYDDCIRWADADIGALVDGLEQRGLLDETLVVITSDHGEEFREHGAFGHGHTLYGEQLRIPLVLHGPGVAATRVAGRAGLADIVPTALDLLGVPVPDGLDGRSLAGVARGGAPLPDRPHLAYLEHVLDGAPRTLAAWLAGDRHLIADLSTGGLELLDTGSPAGEEADLLAAEPETARRMGAELEAALAGYGRADAVEVDALGEEELRQLRELGYVGD